MPPKWRSPYDNSPYNAYNPDPKRLEKYGLTKASYQELWHRQGGLCAICEEILYQPHIDHNHKTMQVRGLLCPSCNTRLVAALEDPNIGKARAYLRKFSRKARRR